jgi:hypothetical protein
MHSNEPEFATSARRPEPLGRFVGKIGARRGDSTFAPTSHLPGASSSPPPLCNERAPDSLQSASGLSDRVHRRVAIPVPSVSRPPTRAAHRCNPHARPTPRHDSVTRARAAGSQLMASTRTYVAPMNACIRSSWTVLTVRGHAGVRARCEGAFSDRLAPSGGDNFFRIRVRARAGGPCDEVKRFNFGARSASLCPPRPAHSAGNPAAS